MRFPASLFIPAFIIFTTFPCSTLASQLDGDTYKNIETIKPDIDILNDRTLETVFMNLIRGWTKCYSYGLLRGNIYSENRMADLSLVHQGYSVLVVYRLNVVENKTRIRGWGVDSPKIPGARFYELVRDSLPLINNGEGIKFDKCSEIGFHVSDGLLETRPKYDDSFSDDL